MCRVNSETMRKRTPVENLMLKIKSSAMQKLHDKVGFHHLQPIPLALGLYA